MRNRLIPCPSPKGTNFERLFLVRQPQLALDAAMQPDEPDNNGASQAYSDLYQHLESNNDDEALALLKHLMNCMSDGGASAMDEPLPYKAQTQHSCHQMQSSG